MDDPMNQASTQITMLMRAVAQMARRLAEARRRRLMAAQQADQARRAAIINRIEAQRRMAAPVWNRAMDKRFWDAATADEAAYVYGVAARFADMDPDAAMAARRCEAEANERWGLDLRDGEHLDPAPVQAPDQGAQERARQAAPLLDGEDASVVAGAPAEDEASARAGKERAVESVITTALARHPGAASVVAARDDDGALQLDVHDAAGHRLPEASAELTGLAGRALSPDLLADQLAGRAWDVDELKARLDSPLLRAAASQPDQEAPQDSAQAPAPQKAPQAAQGDAHAPTTDDARLESARDLAALLEGRAPGRAPAAVGASSAPAADGQGAMDPEQAARIRAIYDLASPGGPAPDRESARPSQGTPPPPAHAPGQSQRRGRAL